VNLDLPEHGVESRTDQRFNDIPKHRAENKKARATERIAKRRVLNECFPNNDKTASQNGGKRGKQKKKSPLRRIW
jgi:hypothetical protein